MADTNTINELMDLDPVDLTTENLASIIAYHRKARANAASGVKAKKEKGPSIDISEALKSILGTPAPVQTVRRR